MNTGAARTRTTRKKSTLKNAKNGNGRKKPFSRKMANSATPAPLQTPTTEMQEPVATATEMPPPQVIQESAEMQEPVVTATTEMQEPAVAEMPPQVIQEQTEMQEPAVAAEEMQELPEIPPQVMQEPENMQSGENLLPPLEAPLVTQEQENLLPPSEAPPLVQVIQESENVQSPEMSGQEQVQESVDMQPVVAEEQKEEDTIKSALMEQLRKIKEQTEQIENQLRTGGMMKKRKKTFYKRYKSKKSMKRRNKTSRNN